MRYSTLLRTAAASALLACAGSAAELQVGQLAASRPTITAEKSVYTRAEVEIATGTGIRATLVGSPERPYYARLGDAFNSAIEQNPLYVAEGSDGMLERQVGGAWVKVEGPILIEGVREVVLQVGKTYTVFAHQPQTAQPGTYRISIAVRDKQAGSSQSDRIVSPTFEIR